ncbi:peroxiredoxin [Reichenbachiella sp. MALMAid0571]|uniref:peroxiredoxin n=1 Tax=Reichenbachiella sp. MALMAid0571 TaxID=3143939 RepID=UPI0032E0330D
MPNKISVGDTIPNFTLLDQNSKEVSITNKIGQPLVIYFYPKDDTPGCTKEACSFRDQYDVFGEYGTEIIGISSDSPASHLKFAKKYNLNFILLSDEKGEVEKLFGVPRSVLGLISGRVTYIIDKNGVVRHVFNSLFNAEKHVEESLRIIKSME